MKNFSLVLIAMMISVSAFSLSPAKKVPNAPTDPLYQESADQSRGAIVEKKIIKNKKKFKPEQSVQKDIKEAEELEQRDESSPE